MNLGTSNEALQKVTAASVAQKNRVKKSKKLMMKTFSVGTNNSEVSTTVVAPSHATRGIVNATSYSLNFGEPGTIASINDTPRSRYSVDLKARRVLTKQSARDGSKKTLKL